MSPFFLWLRSLFPGAGKDSLGHSRKAEIDNIGQNAGIWSILHKHKGIADTIVRKLKSPTKLLLLIGGQFSLLQGKTMHKGIVVPGGNILRKIIHRI